MKNWLLLSLGLELAWVSRAYHADEAPVGELESHGELVFEGRAEDAFAAWVSFAHRCRSQCGLLPA